MAWFGSPAMPRYVTPDVKAAVVKAIGHNSINDAAIQKPVPPGMGTCGHCKHRFFTSALAHAPHDCSGLVTCGTCAKVAHSVGQECKWLACTTCNETFYHAKDLRCKYQYCLACFALGFKPAGICECGRQRLVCRTHSDDPSKIPAHHRVVDDSDGTDEDEDTPGGRKSATNAPRPRHRLPRGCSLPQRVPRIDDPSFFFSTNFRSCSRATPSSTSSSRCWSSSFLLQWHLLDTVTGERINLPNAADGKLTMLAFSTFVNLRARPSTCG